MSTVASPRTDDDRSVARVFLPVATGYWRGGTATEAWALFLLLGLAVLVGIAGNVGFSMWNRWFFDGLEQHDAPKLLWSLLALLGIVLVATANEAGLVLARETLQVRWRAWFTRELTGRWLGRQRFYHLNSAGGPGATVPEYRIADDIRWATEPVMDFYIGILGATVSIVSFAGILWVVGGSITLGGTTIPGYMVLAGIIHGISLTALMMYCGRTLPRNMAARNEAEAHFRLGLMRVRENAESIAMGGGEPGKRALLARGLDALVKRWMTVVRQDGQLTLILKANGVLQPVVPLLLATPKYLTGELSLGAMMQLASAYIPFQTGLAWIFDNYKALSIWHASAQRVAGLIHSMRELDADLDDPELSAIKLTPSSDGRIHVAGLTVANRQGQKMVRDADLVIAPGEKLLLTGDSGTGKSALARAIVGLWPWGCGAVRMPPDLRIGYSTQRAHLPLGSLRDALCYPHDIGDTDDAAIVAALARCGIGGLAPRLDAVERWDQLLSNGQRQRFAIARLILQRPDIVVLDDALAALDEDSQADLMTLLCHDLPEATIIGVAQHTAMKRFHDRVLVLDRHDSGARLRPVDAPDLAVVAN
jgi:vitamin B12/bleomycin/antimicrobial peptide transport system ATP-binding/permease protein